MNEPPAPIVHFLDRRRDAIGIAAIEDFEPAWRQARAEGENAVFQAGSLSKSVTSATALELVARGALTGSTKDGSGAVVMTAGCRPPLVLPTLLAVVTQSTGSASGRLIGS